MQRSNCNAILILPRADDPSGRGSACSSTSEVRSSRNAHGKSRDASRLSISESASDFIIDRNRHCARVVELSLPRTSSAGTARANTVVGQPRSVRELLTTSTRQGARLGWEAACRSAVDIYAECLRASSSSRIAADSVDNCSYAVLS
jgi:hypothetical protein